MRSRHSQKSGQETRETSPAQAVQIALDRRDNGGDAHVTPHPTPPTASLTRQ
jgi:hypothetical protein